MSSTSLIDTLRAGNPVREQAPGSPELLAEILASPVDPRFLKAWATPSGRRRRRRGRLAFATTAVAVAAAALALASSLSGPRTGIAQAAVFGVLGDAPGAGPPLPRGFARAYVPAGPIGEKFGLLESLTVYVKNSSSFGVWLTPGRRGMCIVARDSDGGAGGSCNYTASALAGDLIAGSGGDNRRASLFGVAPNADATVTVRYVDGATRTIPVVHNVYVVPDANAAVAVTLRTAAGSAATVPLPHRS
jgi:hypothetical protein